MSDDFLNELAALSSIYTLSTVVPAPPNKDIYILALPSQTVSLRISIPRAYPAVPPEMVGTEHIGDGLQKGYGTYVLDIARSILKRVWRQGDVCLFDLIEDLESALSPAEEDGLELGGANATADAGGEEGTVCDAAEREKVHGGWWCGNGAQATEAPAWVASEVMEVKKSVFMAWAVMVESPAMAKTYIAHLLATDRKVARATHNISAYRIRSSTSSSASGNGLHNGESGKPQTAGITFQDCDSDGEDAAGGRLLHLLQAMGVWDVLV
ncbi:MAG: hypothetical protein LQ347_004032, partial [Umbilicaria vellea]